MTFGQRKPRKPKAPKPKTCKCGCGEKFIPARPMQVVKTPHCAQVLAEKKRRKAEEAAAKEDRKKTRAIKESLKTRRDYMKEAQVAFNAYIRERDKDKRCICCGLPLELDAVGGGFDCGHYRSVGSAPHLRFDERNAHGQRKQCNRWGAGRAVDYRIGLVFRIGLKAVEELEADQSPRHFSKDDLIAIRDAYRQKLKELKKFGPAGDIALPKVRMAHQ